MRTAAQSEIRSWARAQGMHVSDRGSLPAVVTAAYAATASTSKGTTPMATAAKRTSRKSATPARKRTAAPTRTAKATAASRAKPTRGTRPAAKATASKPAVAAVAAPHIDAPVAGSIDLAGGLRSYLDSVKVEVLAVSALSEQIDELVAALNAAREEKATRLLVLDALRDAFSDAGQYGFLDQLIKPLKTRIPEVVPARLDGE
ncbi:MAG: hypothetical protein JWP14_1398 [Frankiales bacterium]|nr:hypothetical protein [Frankiales bacterium]